MSSVTLRGYGKLLIVVDGLSEANTMCLKCKNLEPIQERKVIKPAMVIGHCRVVENTGEFENAVYHGNPFLPCSGLSFKALD